MIQYEGMYVLFPKEEDGYYYFLRFFEEGYASGRMIMGNFEFSEFYLSTYYELEKKQNFKVDIIGKQILLESNLVFDLQGTMYPEKLRLVGRFKNGEPWMNGEVNDYIFIPYNMVNDPRKVWKMTYEKQPLSIQVDGYDFYLQKAFTEINNPTNYPTKDLIVDQDKIVGVYLDGEIILFNQ